MTKAKNHRRVPTHADLKQFDFGHVVRKLDRLTCIVEQNHRVEMAALETEARYLGAQLDELANGLDSTPMVGEAKFLRTVAARLNAIGAKANDRPTEEPHTEVPK